MLQKVRQELVQGRTLLQFGLLKGVGQALGMFAPLVVAKFFSSEELFGSYSLAKMVAFFFCTLLIASSQTPFIVFANQEKAKTGKINKSFSVQCSFLFFSLCLFVAIAMLFDEQITVFANINRLDLVYVFLAFVGLAFKSFLCNLFLAMDQRVKNAMAELVYGVLSVSLVFVLYFAGAINLRAVLLIYPLASLFLALVFALTVDFGQLLPLKLDKTHLTGMFHFTKWVMLGATAVYFINWGDLLVLRLYRPMADIGTYNLAYQVFKGTVMTSMIVNSYFLPFITQNINNPAKIKDYLNRKRPKILIVGFIGIGIIFFIAPPLFDLVYKDAFPHSATILRILLVGSLISLYNSFYTPILHAMKKYKAAQIIGVIQVLINLVLDVILVCLMGVIGPAVATVLAYFCRVVMIAVYFRVKLKKLLKIDRMTNFGRANIIRRILKRTNARMYLEIGVRWGTVFLPMKARRKIAIDPAFNLPLYKKVVHIKDIFKNQYFEMTSDEFFDTHAYMFQKEKIDVAFIDGLHTYAQTLKDAENCLTNLSEHGIIVLHDCNPTSEAAAAPSLEIAKKLPGWTGFWSGDVWKTIVYLRSARPDLYVTVLDCDYGLGLITPGNPEGMLAYSPEDIDAMTYRDLSDNRKNILNLHSPDYLESFLRRALEKHK